MTKKHFILIIAFLFAALSILIGSRFFFKDNKKDIKTILASESYSYLPAIVQQYIEDVYIDTGELILTEKNKGYNDYYLNPEYVDYLVAENKEDYEVIPEELVVDYVYSNVASATDLPSYFNLNNVNGKTFVTPQKNQGSYGLCWSFATMEQAESYLLVKQNKTYTNGAIKLFSTRHADYVTAKDAIVDMQSPYRVASRNLTGGGTFGYIANYAVDGLSYVNESWTTYTNPATELEYNVVFNYANSLYELNSTINMPAANLGTVDPAYKAEYLSRLKQAIMAYGGAYVATNSPSGTCSVNLNSNRFIYVDGHCSGTRHAMQIIGWDDNYSYSLCTNIKNSSGDYYISTKTSSCAGDVVSGKGAWILRNSWGNSNKIVYLAYDSQRSDINLATDIDVKNWSIQYRNKGKYLSSLAQDTKIEYSRVFDTPERIVKIKAELLTQNADYQVYVSTTGDANNLVLVDTITADLPGYYTIDLYSKNLQVIGEKFIVEIKSTTGRMTTKSINVYTNSLNGIKKIKTHDETFVNDLSSTDVYKFRITSDVIGIPDNQEVTYRILYPDGEEIIPRYDYEENIIAANKIFSKLTIEGSLNKGEYILQTLYGGEVYSNSNLFVPQKLVSIEGSGTKYDPYLITEPAQLDLIRNSPASYFRLANDIDMTYDTRNPNGLYYNNGKGWDPLFSGAVSLTASGSISRGADTFTGSLDGGGHKIIGLYINRPDEDYVGLFSNIYNYKLNEMSVKDLILENPNITGNNYVGGIAGLASGYSYSSCLSLENIAVNNGKIVGNSYVGGISGYIQGGGNLTGACTDTDKKRFDVHSLFNSATIQANDNYAAGIFGYLTNYRYQSNSTIDIHDIQNVGIIYSENDASGLVSVINDNNGVAITINNAISTGTLVGNNGYGIFGKYTMNSSSGTIGLHNVYYSASKPFLTSTMTYISQDYNIYQKQAYELTNVDKWDGFDNYWIQKTINEIPRIPILKMMDNRFNYISVIDNVININMDSEDPVNILDFIQPQTLLSQYNIYAVNNDVISISPGGSITPNKKGEAKLTIKSLFDGSTHIIDINVKKSPIVYYHSNIDDDVYQQIINDGTGFLEDNKFVRVGYTFDKWTTKPDGSGEEYQNQASINISDDINLYAQWLVQHYIISFSPNNDTTLDPIEITYGDRPDLSDINPKKDGYIFAGWYFDSRFTTPFNGNELITDNVTLYAKWIENTFDVEEDTSYELINDYISVPESLSKDKFNIIGNYTYEIISPSGSNESNTLISTGDTVVIYIDNVEVSRYEVVVMGDANGDGEINSGDLFRIQQHLIRKKALGGIYLFAADYYFDEEVNSGDLYWICKYLINNRK